MDVQTSQNWRYIIGGLVIVVVIGLAAIWWRDFFGSTGDEAMTPATSPSETLSTEEAQ